MKPFIFRKGKGKSSFLPKDGDLEVVQTMMDSLPSVALMPTKVKALIKKVEDSVLLWVVLMN